MNNKSIDIHGMTTVDAKKRLGNLVTEIYQASHNRFYSRVSMKKMKKVDFRIWSEKTSILKAEYIDTPDIKWLFEKKLNILNSIYDKKMVKRKK